MRQGDSSIDAKTLSQADFSINAETLPTQKEHHSKDVLSLAPVPFVLINFDEEGNDLILVMELKVRHE